MTNNIKVTIEKMKNNETPIEFYNSLQCEDEYYVAEEKVKLSTKDLIRHLMLNLPTPPDCDSENDENIED